jgi:hypothetical protein
MNQAIIKPVDVFQSLPEGHRIALIICRAGQKGIGPIPDVAILLLLKGCVPHGVKVAQRIDGLGVQHDSKVSDFPVAVQYGMTFNPSHDPSSPRKSVHTPCT